MKKNKAKQDATRDPHRERLRTQRRSAPRLERPAPSRTEKPTILIVCEGKSTEPSYFRHCRITSATIRTVGTGFNTVSLVEKARDLSEHGHYEEVWCVFDADPSDNPHMADQCNRAIQCAETYGFKVAFSNQAFEYWFILHLEDHQGGGMDRKDYHDKTNGYLKPFGLQYDGKKSKKVEEDFFAFLMGLNPKTKHTRVAEAIRRAKRRYKQLDTQNLAAGESCTTVFGLVERIMKLADRRGLGLSLCLELVRINGGRLHFANRQEGGLRVVWEM